MARHRLFTAFVVGGELGPPYASAYDGMTLREHDGGTETTGSIIDQSHLYVLVRTNSHTTNRGQPQRPWHLFEGTVKA